MNSEVMMLHREHKAMLATYLRNIDNRQKELKVSRLPSEATFSPLDSDFLSFAILWSLYWTTYGQHSMSVKYFGPQKLQLSNRFIVRPHQEEFDENPTTGDHLRHYPAPTASAGAHFLMYSWYSIR